MFSILSLPVIALDSIIKCHKFFLYGGFNSEKAFLFVAENKYAKTFYFGNSKKWLSLLGLIYSSVEYISLEYCCHWIIISPFFKNERFTNKVSKDKQWQPGIIPKQ